MGRDAEKVYTIGNSPDRGDRILIMNGAFEGHEALVSDIFEERGTLMVELIKDYTSLELEYWEVQTHLTNS